MPMEYKQVQIQCHYNYLFAIYRFKEEEVRLKDEEIKRLKSDYERLEQHTKMLV